MFLFSYYFFYFRELRSTTPLGVPLPPIAWSTPRKKLKSGVRVLLSEELQDDESGEDEEYIPHEKGPETEKYEYQSEDDKDSSFSSSNPPSVPPPTPTTPSTHDPEPELEPEPEPEPELLTTWSDDGIFKIPHSISTETPEDANIALRTRSKLCLNSTTLEQIEEAFVPPDIPHMDCDNDWVDDEWMDFLQKITRPLDEIVKGNEQEDEELDPEYNILADEELDQIDKEELRVDKAVKITKKELNNLIAELFEYAEGLCTQTNVTNDNSEELTAEVGNLKVYHILYHFCVSKKFLI